jgi:hypothetical protein
VAGARRDVTLANGGKTIRADFDSAELAMAVIASGSTEADRRIVRKMIELIAVDESVKPPASAQPARRALDLARAFARGKGLPDDGIVMTYSGPEPTLFHLTIFHRRGLVPVTVDVATGRVEEQPL